MDAPIMLTIDEVASRYRVSTITITRWTASGKFPPALRIGRRCRRWFLSDLHTFDERAKSSHRVEQLLTTT